MVLARQVNEMKRQSNSTYRYYYYGSLSGRRDGTAKGCWSVLMK
jgi:hypothetical protein